jgi:DnaK suppressor protein
MDEACARELLQAERDRVEAALRAARPDRSDELSDDDDELGDRASETFQAELDAGLSEDLERQLRAVERAEQRLAAGRFGLSIESGEPIPDERLEVEPTAERTVAEQAAFERGR